MKRYGPYFHTFRICDDECIYICIMLYIYIVYIYIHLYTYIYICVCYIACLNKRIHRRIHLLTGLGRSHGCDVLWLVD